MIDQTPQPKTGHIGLNVTDLDRAIAFYTGIFSFQIIARSDEAAKRFAFLGEKGKGPALTLWEQSEGQFNTHAPGLHHLSFQVDGMDTVEEIERRVRELGARLIYDGVVTHSEEADSGGIFFEDPDGIRLEVFTPSGVGARASASAEGAACGFF